MVSPARTAEAGEEWPDDVNRQTGGGSLLSMWSDLVCREPGRLAEKAPCRSTAFISAVRQNTAKEWS
jgi:hypothetical protein